MYQNLRTIKIPSDTPRIYGGNSAVSSDWWGPFMNRPQMLESAATAEQSARADASASMLTNHGGRSQRHRHHSRRQSPLIAVLIALLLTFLVIGVLGAIRIHSLSTTNDMLQVRLEEDEARLAEANSELLRGQRELQAVVENRFPQLHRLEFDKVLPLHNEYVKNIAFTLIKNSNEHGYEYKIVMDNNTNRRIVPEIKVLLFDRLGVQLGMDEIPKQDVLSYGETRSYSSLIDLIVPGEPHYFYVVVN